jgi:hypothetical protein
VTAVAATAYWTAAMLTYWDKVCASQGC